MPLTKKYLNKKNVKKAIEKMRTNFDKKRDANKTVTMVHTLQHDENPSKTHLKMSVLFHLFRWKSNVINYFECQLT